MLLKVIITFRFLRKPIFPLNKNRNINNYNKYSTYYPSLTYLTHTAIDRILVDWQLSRKPQPVSRLMLSWFPLGLNIVFWDTFYCVWAHGSLRTQAILYSLGTPSGASITCWVIFDLSGHTVARVDVSPDYTYSCPYQL